jgi:hypothetical protein
MKKGLLKLAAVLTAMVLILSSCNSQAVGTTIEKAADFTLPSIDGTAVSLADFRGKTVFLNLWETT